MLNEKLTETTKQHTRCLISGSAKLKPLKGYENAYLVKSEPLGFVFSARIPTEEELIKHYEGYSREDYLSPITVKRYHELLDEFEAYRKTGRILDVGCGVGYFLEEAKKRGWEVHGTEYTDKAIAICKAKGINMQQGKLNPALYQKEMFDIVTSFEVLEHINNPQEEMQNIRKLLRPGGLFYLTTPNFNAMERYLLKEKYNVIQYPEHLSYYTKKTLHYLLAGNGFKKKKLQATGFSITRIRTSLGKQEGYTGANVSDELVRQQLEKNGLMKTAKKFFNTVLNVLALGSSLKAWYIKQENT